MKQDKKDMKDVEYKVIENEIIDNMQICSFAGIKTRNQLNSFISAIIELPWIIEIREPAYNGLLKYIEDRLLGALIFFQWYDLLATEQDLGITAEMLKIKAESIQNHSQDCTVNIIMETWSEKKASLGAFYDWKDFCELLDEVKLQVIKRVLTRIANVLAFMKKGSEGICPDDSNDERGVDINRYASILRT